jgi:hypothetical protein
MASGFASHLVGREPPQFLVHERQQLAGGLRVAMLNGIEYPRNFVHPRKVHHSGEKSQSRSAAGMAATTTSSHSTST